MKKVLVFVFLSMIIVSGFAQQKEREISEKELSRAIEIYSDTLCGDNSYLTTSWVATDIAIVVQGWNLKEVQVFDSCYEANEPFLFTVTLVNNKEMLNRIVTDSVYNVIKTIVLEDLIKNKKLY